MSQKTVVAREYLRVSKDSSGVSRSTDQQHEDNVRAAEENGWNLAAPYADLGSASRYAVKKRGGFAELIQDLAEDAFSADILLLWEPSRGSRDVGEWVGLLKLLADRQVRLHVTSHRRTYDPENHRDWRTLVEDATDSEYESRKTSSRLRRDMAANAQAGRPHGRPVLGYRRVYDPKSGRLLGQEPDPEVAGRIQDMFDRLRRGESIKSIARAWAAAGYLNGAGKPYDHAFITRLARNPQYAGYRIHEPGRKGGQLPSGKAKLIEAAWEPIVDRETFHAVQAIVNAPGRRSNREGKAKHWLSMIAVCHAFDGAKDEKGRITAKKLRGVWHYACRAGCLSVRRDPVDRLVESLIVGYLEREDIAEDVADKERDDAELQKVRDEIATLVGRKTEIEEAVLSGDMSPTSGGRLDLSLDEDIESARRRERELIARPLSTGCSRRARVPPSAGRPSSTTPSTVSTGDARSPAGCWCQRSSGRSESGPPPTWASQRRSESFG